MLTRHRVRKTVGPALIARIDPRSVSRHTLTNLPYTNKFRQGLHAIEVRVPQARPATRFGKAVLYSVEPFLLPDFVFDRSIPIQEEARYSLVEDLVKKRGAVENTVWFARLVEKLEATGVASY